MWSRTLRPPAESPRSFPREDELGAWVVGRSGCDLQPNGAFGRERGGIANRTGAFGLLLRAIKGCIFRHKKLDKRTLMVDMMAGS